MPLWSRERELTARKLGRICGADEAGVGPLAGRVYGAAVILPLELELPGLNDSKKVSPKRREELFAQIVEQSVAWSVCWVEPEEIDTINILNARIKAMDLAIRSLCPAADYALVDGNRDHGSLMSILSPHETVIRGDGSSANMAAASILAKVSRDHYMMEMSEQYPQYEFYRHKGYPTRRHYELLREHGPCPIHRRSFLKRL